MKRLFVQVASFLLTNLNLPGFVSGRIYKGALKNVCVPGLNCYSCPGALGSCPIGALQAVIGEARFHVSYYITGLLMLFGVTLGRFVCGWLCPFGLVQDLMGKTRKRKASGFGRMDRGLRFLKYAVLLVTVILLPMLLVNDFGGASPYFCQYVCPSGTLLGGIPLFITSESLRAEAGGLFLWKAALLVAVLVGAIFVYRPFCKYVCPLGAMYALMNRVSFVRMAVDKEKCAGCGQCARVCPMQTPMPEKPNHPECIRCGSCQKACPEGAIRLGWRAEERRGRNARKARF